MKKEGFLLIQGMMLLMLISMIVLAVSRLVIMNNSTNTEVVDYIEAKYFAASGLQFAQFSLITLPQNSRVACEDVSTQIQNIPLDTGQFSVACTHETASTAHTAENMDNITTTLHTQSTTGYTDNGYLQIENEIIYYAYHDDTSFFELKRGMWNTLPAPHSAGIAIEQNQGYIESTGSVLEGAQYKMNERLPLF